MKLEALHDAIGKERLRLGDSLCSPARIDAGEWNEDVGVSLRTRNDILVGDSRLTRRQRVINTKNHGHHLTLSIVVGDLVDGWKMNLTFEVPRRGLSQPGREVIGTVRARLDVNVDVDRHEPIEIDDVRHRILPLSRASYRAKKPPFTISRYLIYSATVTRNGGCLCRD